MGVSALKERLDQLWILELVDLFVIEILEQMCGIKVKSCKRAALLDDQMAAVYGFADGEYPMHFSFRAGSSLFERIVLHMKGEPATEGDVQDYAEEFFNVLCGRFVSEIYQATQLRLQFFPTRYGEPVREIPEEDRILNYIRGYESKDGEIIEFSWGFTIDE